MEKCTSWIECWDVSFCLVVETCILLLLSSWEICTSFIELLKNIQILHWIWEMSASCIDLLNHGDILNCWDISPLVLNCWDMSPGVLDCWDMYTCTEQLRHMHILYWLLRHVTSCIQLFNYMHILHWLLRHVYFLYWPIETCLKLFWYVHIFYWLLRYGLILYWAVETCAPLVLSWWDMLTWMLLFRRGSVTGWNLPSYVTFPGDFYPEVSQADGDHDL